MFRLIKSELAYNWVIISIACSLACTAFVIIWLRVAERNVAPNLMLILLVMTFLGAYVGETRRVEKKRDRMHVLLPIPLIQVGLFRHVFPLVIWISVLTIFFLTSFGLQLLQRLNPEYLQYEIIYPHLNQFIVLNGWILITNTCYLLLLDQRQNTQVKSQRVLFRFLESALPFVAMMPFYLAMNFMSAFEENTMHDTFLHLSTSIPVAVIMNIIGLALLFVNMKYFLKRHSYL